MLIDSHNGLFTTPNCRNVNICPRKTNRHQSQKRGKGQEVHLFNIFTFSDISHCQGIQTMIPLSKGDWEDTRQTGLSDRERRKKKAEWKRKKEKQPWNGYNQFQIDTELPSRLFICCCLHRELGCVEAALSQFFSLSRWVIVILVKAHSRGSA